MCSANRTSHFPLTLSGPATEALEQANKRQRISMSLKKASVESSSREKAFDFANFFHAITPDHQEDFPTIGWDFDLENEAPKETEDEDEDTDLSALLGQKRSRDGGSASSGLLRSKSFKTNLSLLSVSSHTTQSVNNIQRAQNFRPIHPEKASEKISFDPISAACKLSDDLPLFALDTSISSISRTKTMKDTEILKGSELVHNQFPLSSVLA